MLGPWKTEPFLLLQISAKMSIPGDESPDWLRTFQPQGSSLSVMNISSGSEASDDHSLGDDRSTDGKPSSEDRPMPMAKDEVDDMVVRDDHKVFSAKKASKKMQSPNKRAKSARLISEKKTTDHPSKSGMKIDPKGVEKKEECTENHNQSIWALSSDSESHDSPVQEAGTSKLPKLELEVKETFAVNKKKTTKNTEKVIENDDDPAGTVDEMTGKHNKSDFSASIPLVLPEKVNRLKALVECEDSIDISGDVGAVGRVVISNSSSSGNKEMFLDMKGIMYKTTIVPSRTFCVVSFGQSEAKIEAIMNDFIQLKPQSNVYEAETMVEGTLEGFSFDSGDESDRVPKAVPVQADDEETEKQQTNTKSKRKAEKTSTGPQRKRAKTTGKPTKKVKKKAQATKKGGKSKKE